MPIGGSGQVRRDRAGFGRGGADTASDISHDDLYEVLANRRRRHTLHMLKQRGEPLEIGEVAEQVAAWENDTTVRELSSRERKLVYTALQQDHLPKMDELGLVRYDKDRGTIEPTASVEEVDLYLEVVGGWELPWPAYYLGLGGVSVALVIAVWVDAFPLRLLPDVAWMALIAAALTLSAVVHLYYARGMRLGADDVPPEVERDTGT